MQKSDEGKKAKTRLPPYTVVVSRPRSASYTAPEVCPQLYWTARILSHEKVQSSVMVSWLLTSVSAGGSTTVLRSGRGMPDLSGSPNKGAPTFSGRAVFLFGNARSHQRSSSLHSHWWWCRYNIQKSGVLCCLQDYVFELYVHVDQGGRLIILVLDMMYNISPCCHLLNQ